MRLEPDGIPEELIETILVRSGKVRPAQLDDARALIFQMSQLGVKRDLLGALVDRRMLSEAEADEVKKLAAEELAARGAAADAAQASPIPTVVPAGGVALDPEKAAPDDAQPGARDAETACANHFDQTAIAACRHCSKRICSRCVIRTDHGVFCSQACLMGWTDASSAKWAGRAAKTWMANQLGRVIVIGAAVGVLAAVALLGKYLVDDYRFTTKLARASRPTTSAREAVALLSEAVEIRPTDAKARAALGRALFGAGEVGRSIEALSEALKIDPGNVEALEGIARAYMAKRRYEETAAALERLRGQGMSTYEINRQLGTVYLEHLNRQEDAIEAFRAAIKVGSESRELRYLTARALVKIGRTEEAREELRRATLPVADAEGASVGRERAFLNDKARMAEVKSLLAAVESGDRAALERVAASPGAAPSAGSAPGPAAPAGPGSPKPDAAAHRESHLEVLESAKRYARENPTEFDEAISRFAKVRERAAGTPFAQAAEKLIAETKERRRQAAAISFEGAKMKARALAEYDDFDGAIGEIEAVRGTLSPELQAKASAETESLAAQARRKIEDTLARTRQKLAEGDVLGARSTFRILSRVRFSRMKDEFGVRIKVLDDRLASAKKREVGKAARADFTTARVLTGHTHPLTSASFSPDGLVVVTTSEDKTGRLWNVQTGKCLKPLKTYAAPMLHAAFSPDGRYVATASADQAVRVWDVGSGRVAQSLTAHRTKVLHVGYSPDGRNLVTSSADGEIRLWNALTGDTIRVFKGHFSYVVSVGFNQHGDRLLSASHDRTARIWNPDTGTVLHTMSGHKGRVTSAAFNPLGSQVLTASEDKTARIWASSTGREIRALEGHADVVTSACFSPDGTRIATASEDGTARIWDIRTGRELHNLEGHGKGLSGAVFSPDGRRLLTASKDCTARLWEVRSGQEAGVLEGHRFAVIAATFSPDGRRILTASKDGTARIWEAR